MRGRAAVTALLGRHGIPVRSLTYTPVTGSDGVYEGGWIINQFDGAFTSAKDIERWISESPSGIGILARGNDT